MFNKIIREFKEQMQFKNKIQIIVGFVINGSLIYDLGKNLNLNGNNKKTI